MTGFFQTEFLIVQAKQYCAEAENKHAGWKAKLETERAASNGWKYI